LLIIPGISASLYTLILYLTISPFCTINGFFGCKYVLVVSVPVAVLEYLKFASFVLSILGILLTVGACPSTDSMNFLNAKSYFFSSCGFSPTGILLFLTYLLICLSIPTTGW